MKTYQVLITETLQRLVTIECGNEIDALEKIKELYRKEEIVLNEDDFINVELEIIKD